jgi:hypothetical protein
MLWGNDRKLNIAISQHIQIEQQFLSLFYHKKKAEENSAQNIIL